MNRPRRIVLETPSGEQIILDEETTRQVYEMADAKGMLVMDVIRQAFHKGHETIFSKNN